MEIAVNMLRSDVTTMETGIANATAVLKSPAGDYTVFIVMTGLVSVFILVSNCLVIGTIAVTPSLHTRPNIYVVSLSVTDFMVGVVGLLSMSQYLTLDWFNASKTACLSIMSLMYFTCTCSIFNIVLMALDRYVYILKPFLYERVVTKCRIAVAIVVIWVAALLYGAAVVLYSNFELATRCMFKEVVPALLRCYIAVPLFFICCSVTSFVYTKIGQLTVQTLKEISRTRAHFIQVAAAVQPQRSPLVDASSGQSFKTSNSRYTQHSLQPSQQTETTDNQAMDAEEAKTVSDSQSVYVNPALKDDWNNEINCYTTVESTGFRVNPIKVTPWDTSSVPTVTKDTLPSPQYLPSRACPDHQPSQLASSPPLPPPVNQQQRTFPPGSLKAVRLFIVVSGVLLACWAPSFIAEIINVFMPVSDYVYYVTCMLGLLNSGFNAVAFIFMNKELRQVLIRCIRRRCLKVCCPNRDGRVGQSLHPHFSRTQGRPGETERNTVNVAIISMQ